VAENDDLLSADEIEALMQAARSGSGAPGPAAPASSPPGGSDLLDPSEIEALMRGAAPAGAMAGAGSPKDTLGSGDIEALMAAAGGRASGVSGGGSQGSFGPGQRPKSAIPSSAAPPVKAEASRPAARAAAIDLSAAQDFEFEQFQSANGAAPAVSFPIAALEDVELDLRIELGRTELLVEEVLQMREGTVVPLDKLAGDPVDILINGRLIARGEVLVLNDNFCVRVAEILTPH
jgi:flagellar motor switch protein FliN